MNKHKRSAGQQLSQIVLMLHGLLYTLGWGLAFYTILRGGSSMYQLIIMVWSLLLIVHVGVHFYFNGQNAQVETTEIERQAYRDGFADAMRQLQQEQGSSSRLALDEDGELVEFHSKRKRIE